MQVLNDQGVVNSVECLGEIDEGKNHSSGLGSVNVGVDEMEKTDQVVRYQRTL